MDEQAGEQNPTVLGLEFQPLADGLIPLEAVVLVKCLNDDGEPVIEVRVTDGLHCWDRIGLLTMALDVARHDAQDCFRRVDEDDD